MKYILPCSIGLILLMCGCSNSKEESHVTTYIINPDERNTMSYDSFIDSIEYIPLDTQASRLIGEIKQLVVTSKGFIINSEKAPVAYFNDEGNFLFHLGNIGRASNEYISIQGVSIKDNTAYLFDEEKKNLILFSLNDGKHQGTLRLGGSYIKAYVDGDHIYATDYNDGVKLYAIPINNTDTKTLIYQTPNSLTGSLKMRQKITQSPDGLFWTDPLTGKISLLKDGKMSPYLDINFANGEIPDEVDDGITFDEAGKYIHNIGDVAVCNHHMYLSYWYDTEMSSLINMETGNTCNVAYLTFHDIFPNDKYAYKKLPSILTCDDEYFYQIGRVFFNNPKMYLDVPQKYATFRKLENLSADDIYILKFKAGSMN